MKGVTADEIKRSISNINNNSSADIIPHATYTLPQTLEKVKTLTFKPNDIIILNTLTNDARQTKTRQSRTPTQTKNIQTAIILHLKTYVPPDHIIILESPPLLVSPTNDIFPFNENSFLLSRDYGIRFAKTLIGESHIFRDGYHILRNTRHLLIKSVVAAIKNVDPHLYYGLKNPPFGHFGPWTTPKPHGILPLTYGEAALKQPIFFRRAAIPSLMDINIHRMRSYR